MKKKETVTASATGEMDEIMPRQSRGKRIASTIINVILVIAILIAAFCTYVSFVNTSGNGVPNILGVRILSIQTESMYPYLKPGDLIFDTAVKNPADLKVKDVITYWTIIDGQRVLNTHRIVEIYDGGGYLIFQTQGDNNTVEDPLTVHESEIVGQYKGTKIGGLGKVFDYLQTSIGFLIVVVIPVAIFFIFHLIQFFRVLFEYNNVKNKLLYEQERGKTENLVEDEKKRIDEVRRAEREKLEAELREKLKAELLAASMPSAEEEPSEAEAAAKSEEELRAETEARIRAEMEAEIRSKIKAEMEAEADKTEADKAEDTSDKE